MHDITFFKLVTLLFLSDMNKQEVKHFLEGVSKQADRGIVIVDWANVEKWPSSLGWKVGIRQLRNLTNHLTRGKKTLRRIYYALDYGQNEKNPVLSSNSQAIQDASMFNKFEFITKRVKYIHDKDRASGFQKKGNLDVEMTVDLIVLSSDYDQAFVFSGDGDLSYVYKHLHELKKEIYVFAARDHIGKEVIDAEKIGIVKAVLFVEDFESRLDHRK